MSYDFEWRRGDTDALIMTLTTSGVAIDLSGYSKITFCVTSLSEPTDATTLLWKEDATILDQVTNTGQISIDMTSHADEDVNVPMYYDVQGITTVGGKIKTLVPSGIFVYRQDKNKDTS